MGDRLIQGRTTIGNSRPEIIEIPENPKRARRSEEKIAQEGKGRRKPGQDAASEDMQRQDEALGNIDGEYKRRQADAKQDATSPTRRRSRRIGDPRKQKQDKKTRKTPIQDWASQGGQRRGETWPENLIQRGAMRR